LLAAIYAYFVLYGAMVQTEAFYILNLSLSLSTGPASSIPIERDTRFVQQNFLWFGEHVVPLCDMMREKAERLCLF
jgi:hypothetical protein